MQGEVTPSTPVNRCTTRTLIDSVDAELDRPAIQRALPYCIVLCLASAMVWTWSIAWVPSLLHNAPPAVHFHPAELPPRAVVVDCGSGKVAVHRYATSGEGTARRPREVSKAKAAMKLPELVASLDSGGLQPLWDLVDGALIGGGDGAGSEGWRRGVGTRGGGGGH